MGLPAGSPYHKRRASAAQEESFARLHLPHTHTYAQNAGMVPDSTFFVPEAVVMIKVSPSILSADFVNLERDIRALTPAGADYVHILFPILPLEFPS